MSHDDHMLSAFDHLTQRMRLYTRLYTRHLLYLFGFSAVVGDLFPFLYYDLISTTTEGKVDRHTRVIIILVIAASLVSDTDTERHRHLISDPDIFYVLKQAELVLL